MSKNPTQNFAVKTVRNATKKSSPRIKPFSQKVYETVMQIPRGKVATYGDVAGMSGNPHASRAVGWALHRNPAPDVIPCHRVVNRSGKLAPAFVFGGPDAQKKLLLREGVSFLSDDTVDVKRYGWRKTNIKK